jgi:uncharacterized protein YprB with RNaseH-like and TPR domain
LLERTFIHIQGIGEKTEQKLWQGGIYTWEQFLNCKRPIFNHSRDAFVRSELEKSFTHQNDIRFFRDRVSSAHMWRFYQAFKSKAVYLDIETSGGYLGVDEITVIGIYDGYGVRAFVNGVNLHDFESAIAGYDLIITFNGGSFDLPFIRRSFPNISLPPAHIDLRFFLKRLGYRGGLKSIERQFGLVRDRDIDGMDGYDAVKLWKAHQWGDPLALDLLIKYNTADIVNLEPLMQAGFQKMKSRLLPQAERSQLEAADQPEMSMSGKG